MLLTLAVASTKGAIQCYGEGSVIKDHTEWNFHQDGIVGAKFGGNQNSDGWDITCLVT